MELGPGLAREPARWSDVFRPGPRPRPAQCAVGVLAGEGIGPEVVAAALDVLAAVQDGCGTQFDLDRGGAIGREAELLSGCALTAEVSRFCEDIFAREGAILAGPGGGRFVYELRRRFDLYCKLSPIRPSSALHGVARVKPECVQDLDLLLVRENTGGEYLGESRILSESGEGRVAEHSFRYSEVQVRRLLEAAAALAARRRGLLAVAVKEHGLPAVSGLWREVGEEVASRAGVAFRAVDIDLAAYRLVQDPRSFDVLAASNLFGDILADLAAVLLGSRGVSFSGNFSAAGAAVYQTNHGAAYELAGSNRANPIGQIFSLAMMLRESFGMTEAALAIEQAVDDVLRHGFRTFDVAEAGTTLVGTREMGIHVASAVRSRLRASAR